MHNFIEFILWGEEGGTVLINPSHVCAFNPHFDQDGLWQGCNVHLANGQTLRVNYSLEQIEDVLKTNDAAKVAWSRRWATGEEP